MAEITLTVPETLMALLTRKAAAADRSIESEALDLLRTSLEGDPDHPEFKAALGATLRENAGLLRRLGE